MSLRAVTLLTLALVTVPACERSKPTPLADDETPAAPRADSSSPPATPPPKSPCPDAPRIETLAPGLTLETLRPSIPAAFPVADPCLRVLRADPERFEVVLGAAAEAPLTAPAWAERTGAVGVINASMYLPNGRSTGLLVDGDEHRAKVNPSFGAFFAAGPRAERDPGAEVAMWGEGCPGSSLTELRRDYRILVQNYRLLDCEGKPIAWKDEKAYSAAAVGLDASGKLLFILSRAPYQMSTFTQILVDPALGLDLVAAMYVEGGPEATLAVRTDVRTAVFVGSYETEFVENDGNADAWPLPNVLMLVPRIR